MFKNIPVKTAIAASAIAPVVIVAAHHFIMLVVGEAWDDGYRIGRTAEREDWNWPTRTKR